MQHTCLILLGLTALLALTVAKQSGLERPPVIKSKLRSKYYVSKSVVHKMFPCQTDGNPEPSVYWTQNNQKFESTELKRIYPNGTLHIVKIVTDITLPPYKIDWGRYQCFAENKFGKAMGRPFLLMEAVNDPFTDGITTGTDNRGVEGLHKSIKCPGVEDQKCTPKSKCRIEWKVGEGTNNPLYLDTRIAVDTEGTLHFAYLKKSDQKNSDLDFYACSVFNEETNSLTKGPQVKLTVVDSTVEGSSTVDPSPVFHTATVEAMIGETALCQCVFRGKPESNLGPIQWFREDSVTGMEVEINSGGNYSIEDSDRKLIFKYVNEKDEGRYTCQLKGIRNTCFLNVTSPPIFDDETKDKPQGLTLPEGEDAVFRCKSRSLPNEKPPFSPAWYQNGKLIKSGTAKLQLSTDNTTLVVKNVQKPIKGPVFNPMDVGSYVCEVSNTFGTVYGFGSLNVIEPIIITLPIEDSVEILPGEIKTLSVDATTDPQLNLEYIWSFTKKDDEYTLSQRDMILSNLFEFSTGRKNVTINAKNLKGSEIYQVIGVYTVVIRHQYENKTLTSEFTTDSTIEPPVIAPGPQLAAFDFWILAVVLGCLVLFIVIILIICLCYRNRGGTYPVDKKEVEAGHDPEKELKDSGFHDLSRADDFDNPGYDNVSLSSLKPIESDEDSMGEYGEIDIAKFNEDGSFIGLYAEKKKPTQSTV